MEIQGNTENHSLPGEVSRVGQWEEHFNANFNEM